MSLLWDSLYSVFECTRNYLVDPLGEENPENPELAITGEGRGATYHNNTAADGQQGNIDMNSIVRTLHICKTAAGENKQQNMKTNG